VLIRRQLEYRGVELVVILQPDGSLACIPTWMTHEAAAQCTLSAKPRFSVDILRSLRAEIDVLLRFLPSESKTEEADNDPSIQKPYMSGGLSRHYPHFSSALSPSFCSILSAHLFVPTLMPVEHGAQDRSRTARWRRPKGLSLNDRAPCYD
jgi:hypothetical protein